MKLLSARIKNKNSVTARAMLGVMGGVFAVGLLVGVANAEQAAIPLLKAPGDITDQASLQRGAQLYINNCLGCHGLKYERYDSIAQGIGITDEAGNVLDKVVKDNLLFTGDKITDPIVTAMATTDAEKWFGTAPPDLTLVARVRGKDWLYTYLKSFYHDPSKPWGTNNLVFPDVAMPHVLVSLQGIQEPRYVKASVAGSGSGASAAGSVAEAGGGTTEKAVIQSLELVIPGTMTLEQYDHAVADLVNFLSYVAEPVQVKRQHTGALVLVFLGIFLVFSYLLKREYWKDVHH